MSTDLAFFSTATTAGGEGKQEENIRQLAENLPVVLVFSNPLRQHGLALFIIQDYNLNTLPPHVLLSTTHIRRIGDNNLLHSK